MNGSGNTMTPRFEHHCPFCRHLLTDTRADWYHCSADGFNGTGSIVGRYNNDVAAYWSMPVEVVRQATGKYVSDFMRTARKLAAALP